MKGRPTRRQTAARRDQRQRGQQLRDWLQGTADKIAQRRAKAIAEDDKTTQAVKAEVDYLIRHVGTPYAGRRAWAKDRGRALPGSKNETYYNDAKDRRLAGKARRNARRQVAS